MTNNNSFVSFDNKQKGLLFTEENHETYPIKYHNIINEDSTLNGDKKSSFYGYIYKGAMDLKIKGISSKLKQGVFFSTSEEFSLKGEFSLILIEVLHEKGIYPETKYKAVTTLGEIEKEGRLKYIDGCTDSLLIPPVKMGNPCFNHLHFPSEIDQTPHTHPSHRIGIVAKGNGLCKTPFGNVELKEGMIFIIKEWDNESYSKGIDGKTYPNGTHSFQTFEEEMDVIAFHPDSDFGATDIDHPMINRTIVNGVSANQLKDIRTK
jgi:hypothetical protein